MSIDTASTARASTGNSVERAAGEVPGHAAEQERVGDPVADRVEERTPLAGGAALAGDRPVEHVGEAGEQEPEHRRGRGARWRSAPRSPRRRPARRSSEPSAVTPSGCRPRPTGSRARSTFARQRPIEHCGAAPPRVRGRSGGSSRLGGLAHGRPNPSEGTSRPVALPRRSRPTVRSRSDLARLARGCPSCKTVPDGEDPQRRPGRPRRRRQDHPGRGAAVRRRGHAPPGPGRGRHHRHRLRPRGAQRPHLGVAGAGAVRVRRATRST